MSKFELSANEQKWYDRLKKAIEEEKSPNYCSWWLRIDYEKIEPNITTSKINYWLTKCVKKGYLKKNAFKSFTNYSLIHNELPNETE